MMNWLRLSRIARLIHDRSPYSLFSMACNACPRQALADSRRNIVGLSVASCLPRRQGTSALSSTSSSGKVRNCVARCKQARASAHVKHKTEQAVPNCCTPRSTNAAKGKLSGSKFSSNQVEANSRPIHVSHKFKYPAPPPLPFCSLATMHWHAVQSYKWIQVARVLRRMPQEGIAESEDPLNFGHPIMIAT